ncbi:hypothetical protein P9D34_20430 [Bacillus swezeyi]|uniref:Uncharacterized protein n=2 Tax=Bacillus swezeyi TaxID=1925020 RepID=A0A1R1RPR1_9BACI|nr:hypothetical protein [Bacillus swezeyi]MEC1262744.1 hypothetical protein [Bacillus swezeyi]MED1740271.1 hypothetical protein [Bacillus swezeyi]MED2928587.1 hypothetical protein [Bacillus swezeyi]MED2945213.1 hypothetical protein [Bacillus swezeyi]MED2962916.1 hypothetical protein [Bacillus swezeyi]
MKDKARSIFEDLLPLYHEGLLSKETAEWIEEQAENDEELQKLLKMSGAALLTEDIESSVHEGQMFKRINRKLSLYQIIFTVISFFLAMKTSLLNESFGFILWYAVLGFVTYLFYRDMKIVLLLSFVPIFVWGISDILGGWDAADGTGFAEQLLNSVLGAFMLALVHCLFAIAGSLIGWLCVKLKEGS